MGIADQYAVIDCDTHLVEPPDLWTSRMPKKWGNVIPHVETLADGSEHWFTGDLKLSAAAGAGAFIGWDHFPPDCPTRWSDVDVSAWDAKARLARMDEYGIHAQILYPNVGLCNGGFIQGEGRQLRIEMLKVYNDYQTEWSSIAPDRFVPITVLPFWDLQATIGEIQRCAEMGHRGIIFTQDPGAFGQPVLTDRYWDPMWATAQELGLPVNFHTATGDLTLYALPQNRGIPASGRHANEAVTGVSSFMANAHTMSSLICSGVCHRFPELSFVSVESGVGWLPFAMDAIDWRWLNCGVAKEHPEYDLLPSEYFKRQIYGCFWFERENVEFAIERLGSTNILYETDFPHATSMTPGPASVGVNPREYMDDVLGKLPPEALRNVLHDNAARIYHL
jgi:uncharacterized protein